MQTEQDVLYPELWCLQLQLQLYFISIDPYWLKPAKGYRTSQKYIYIQID
jgi:hypothetical protein